MTVCYGSNKKLTEVVEPEAFPEDQNLWDEFSELILGFLDWFSNLIRSKGTPALFSAVKRAVAAHGTI